MPPKLYPIISSIQKIALYETKARFYLVGSNNTQTRFRVLKIDRMEPRNLVVIDDKVEYSQDEIRDLVNMIDVGNRTKGAQRTGAGVARIVSAFGIVEGYYIILVTKRRRVAVIGQHTIYKIEDTSMIYIPNSGVRHFHPDEPRYVKMFQNIDLSSNFYFSYSYDISNTLQVNMAPPRNIHSWASTEECPSESKGNAKDSSDLFTSLFNFESENGNTRFTDEVNYGVRSRSNKRFVWNKYLLKDVETELHPDWMLQVVHGFVGQSNLSIFGRSIYITIVARRSNRYAGTRFLKRGANFEGDVANEVETEQIVHDSSISSLSSGYFTSFVQLRGSVPAHWSQDISKMVPKPAITLDLCDPYAETAGEHFNQLLRRYGSPVIILNLVKKREKKKHESILSEEFMRAVIYLNQFLPPEHHIHYISFDMARKNKMKEADVMARLGEIAYSAVCKTGIFQSQKLYGKQSAQKLKLFQIGQPGGGPQLKGRLQTGLIRVNCVDCLDRTNTAQFALGKCALELQLCALGVLENPRLEFDTDCVRLLESLYEDHGDTLALQYGGSQLVHRIKTYRKTAPWTSQGNDIMQTLSRYYSNTFSDAEKQHTINLFLGLFVPEDNKPQIWELASDYYLHHTKAIGIKTKKRIPLTKWWDEEVLGALPTPFELLSKSCSEIVRVNPRDEMVDSYFDYYRPYEFNILNEMFAFKITHSVRDFMPHFTANYSPFAVRGRPGRRRDEATSKQTSMRNPSMTGQSSTSSTNSSPSEDSDDSDLDTNPPSHMSQSRDSSSGSLTFESLFPSMKQVYGVAIEQPSEANIQIYNRFVEIGHQSVTVSQAITPEIKFVAAQYGLNSSLSTSLPKVSPASLAAYKKFVEVGIRGPSEPSKSSLLQYQNYVNKRLISYEEWDMAI
ncbi:hypothetical protein B566_EDAN007133 [Ephemera danica]|nr:hypothetical protein B566_EDAN007133 [Ephemera danica]